MNKIRDQYAACPQYGMSSKNVIWSCKVHILVSKKIAFASRQKKRNCILYYNYIFLKYQMGFDALIELVVIIWLYSFIQVHMTI